MKNSILVLAFALIGLFGLHSCSKENDKQPVTQQTIDAQLKVNESYTFTLPGDSKASAYHFTTQASHYKISALGKDASGNRIYSYTPTLNYEGSDTVVLSNEGDHECESHSGCGGGHTGGEHHHDSDDSEKDGYVVTINFTIAAPSTGTK